MTTDGVSAAEQVLAKVLLPLCVLSGALVLSGFFFPEFVGNAVSEIGRASCRERVLRLV